MEISLSDIAKAVNGKIIGDATIKVKGAAPFEKASYDHITFAIGGKFLKNIKDTMAGSVLIPLKHNIDKGFIDKGLKKFILVDNPEVAFAKILHLFNPDVAIKDFISPGSFVSDNCIKGKNVFIGHNVVIGKNVTLGSNVYIDHGVVLRDNVVIGDNVKIYPNVTIMSSCIIGSRVIIHAGTVIGSDGFGFACDGSQYHKLIHTGIVQVDDDVEIGANNTIDRATFGKTWIQKGVKIDNLVHIAHNVTVGENTVIAAQTGIAGSTTIGKNCILAGQAGISDHLTISDRSIIGPRAGIAESVKSGEIISGTPGMPHRLWLKMSKILPRLPEIRKQVNSLEKRLKNIEQSQKD